MTTPDHSEIVERICSENPEALKRNDEAAIFSLMMKIGAALFDVDPYWGFLTKTAGEKNIKLANGQRISVDSFIYKPTMQVVDVLANAMEAGVNEDPARPAWQHKSRRESSEWYPIVPVEDNGQDEEDSDELSELKKRVKTLELLVATLQKESIQSGAKIALMCNKGFFICAEGGGPDEEAQAFYFTARKNALSWETFEIKKQ